MLFLATSNCFLSLALSPLVHLVKDGGWWAQYLASGGELLGKWMVKLIIWMKAIWLEFSSEKLGTIFRASGCYFCS